MLDRSKVIQEFKYNALASYNNILKQERMALEIWNQIVSDKTFINSIKNNYLSWNLPVPYFYNLEDSEENLLNFTKSIISHEIPYTVIAVDGSQIYPDRHQGIQCSLINIGVAKFDYGSEKPVYFENSPYIDFGQFDNDKSIDFINCKRTELEFKTGFKVSFNSNNKNDLLFMCDGSLIFWHLASKDIEIKDKFLNSYLKTLEQFFEEKIAIAGYISLPQSKELINLLRYKIYNISGDKYKAKNSLELLTDLQIAKIYIKPNCRSIIFENNSEISSYYPTHLKPYFFYINTGIEIGRVEIPAWIAQNKILIDKISSIILDQAHKGHGYPLCLSEAHEQAVVKNADREFFYSTLRTIIEKEHNGLALSRKSINKRSLTI